MIYLVVITIFLQFLCISICTQLTHVHHMCSGGVCTEQAGIESGTIKFTGLLCNLTITNIPSYERGHSDGSQRSDRVNRLNIAGVRSGSSCGSSHIFVDSQTYCIDMSVKDTVIKVSNGQVNFVVTSRQANPFTIRYYTGMKLIIVYHTAIFRSWLSVKGIVNFRELLSN